QIGKVNSPKINIKTKYTLFQQCKKERMRRAIECC
uniref:Uncharacterized protein n=1 Tax=Panagrolaimus sp. PS1159 TaxID=55785 RepID=A0AC35GCP7_9BILA